MIITPTVCFDAGHGGHDPGAVGPSGLREKDVALKVALMAGVALMGKCNVLYTRRTDVFVGLTERATFANREKVDIFVSVHCNSGPEGQGTGFEVWTSKGQTASDWLATDLFNAYAAEFPTVAKRMDMSDEDVDKESQFTVLTRTNMAAALFELEFIHRRGGEAFLQNEANLRRAADALARGVAKYLKLDSQAVTPPVAVPVAVGETPTLLEFYESIRDAADVDQAVADLTSRGLRELGGYLMRTGACENNVAGDVLGRVMVEGWRRFAAMNEGGKTL